MSINNDVLNAFEKLNGNKDAYISDIFSSIPYTVQFINYLLKNDKTKMSQLSETDIEDAINNSRGVGKQTAEKINKIYAEYINKKSPVNIDDELECISIEQAFGSSAIEESFKLRCHEFGITNVLELKSIITAAALLRGINFSDIEEKFMQLLLDSQTDSRNDIMNPLFAEEDIPLRNISLPVEYLKHADIADYNIELLKENGYITLKDLIDARFSLKIYRIIKKSESIIKQPYTAYFINALNSLPEDDREILLQRIQGCTLDDISYKEHLSRERIRQKISSTCKRLMNGAEIIAKAMMLKGKPYFRFKELKNEFINTADADFCWHVLKQSDKLVCLSFADKLIAKDYYPENLENTLYKLTVESYGDFFNLSEKLEIILAELIKYGIEFLDSSDIKEYLIKTDYNLYGGLAVKGSQPFAMICYYVILKHFKFDIKLDSDEANTDMKLLREIIDKHYHGLILPESNRNITARLSEILILCGRGLYCPVEKVIYNKNLMDEIYKYIQYNSQITYYYSELYTIFKEKLVSETNITNPYFLHGMLKYLYSDYLSFKKDTLTKRYYPKHR